MYISRNLLVKEIKKNNEIKIKKQGAIDIISHISMFCRPVPDRSHGNGAL
jgi:hypothetical protein